MVGVVSAILRLEHATALMGTRAPLALIQLMQNQPQIHYETTLYAAMERGPYPCLPSDLQPKEILSNMLLGK